MLNEIGKVYHRPWGNYVTTRVEEHRDETGKTIRTIEEKDITVNPGGVLSIQSHKMRAEKWTILEGNPEILVIPRDENDPVDLSNIEEKFNPFKALDIINIGKNWIHAIRNLTNKPVKFHEIQSGICDEEDITRYKDIYGR